ncbi:MAG: glycosyltransferase involved in cell wall biosynthesis [Gammaproteobacteria bacterium]|jgi:glycosyltransferase involved in cell wall biosynthesis
MRILHVIPSYLPAVRYGGPVLSVHGLCRALVRAGDEIDVFTTMIDGDRNIEVESGVRVEMDGVGVHYFATATPRRWYYSPAMSAALNTRIANYDIVHIHALFLHPVSAAAHAARRARVPYLISPRGMLVRSLFAQRSKPLKSVWMALLGRRLLARAAAVHVTSATERDDVGAFNLRLNKVLDIPNGIDGISADGERIVRDSKLVLFLGRVTWKKQVDRLVSAMASCPELNLVVIGPDDEGLVPALQHLARQLNVEQRVRFLGAMHGEERDEWYLRAGMFVLPSRSENFANAVLEAMAAGCPVIVTPQVGLGEVVRDSGCGIVCDGSIEALSESMRQIADHPDRARKMGSQGRQVVNEGFLWSAVAARMRVAYREIIGDIVGIKVGDITGPNPERR